MCIYIYMYIYIYTYMYVRICVYVYIYTRITSTAQQLRTWKATGFWPRVAASVACCDEVPHGSTELWV